MDIEMVKLQLKNAREPVEYHSKSVERISIYLNEVVIVLNRFKNAEEKRVEEVLVYPKSSLEYYLYIEVE
jgi:hypothetical protein